MTYFVTNGIYAFSLSYNFVSYPTLQIYFSVELMNCCCHVHGCRMSQTDNNCLKYKCLVRRAADRFLNALELAGDSSFKGITIPASCNCMNLIFSCRFPLGPFLVSSLFVDLRQMSAMNLRFSHTLGILRAYMMYEKLANKNYLRNKTSLLWTRCFHHKNLVSTKVYF